MATGCVQGCQTPRALPQDQCVCSVRPSARQDSAASPGRLRESGAGCPGDRQKVNKPWDIKAHVSASFAPRLHSNALLFTGGKQWMGVSSTPWSRQWLSGAIRSAPSWRKTPLRLCWKAKAPHHTQSCSSGTTGPVLCYYRRCMSTDGLWVALVQCRDCMKIKTRPQRTSKVELLFSKFLLWLIILVSEGTPVLSSEKCDLEPTASFLFCFFCRLQQNHTCWGQYPLLLSFVSSAHMWQRPVCFPSVLLFGHMQIWNVSTVIALDKFNLSLATVYLNYVLSGDLITFHH